MLIFLPWDRLPIFSVCDAAPPLEPQWIITYIINASETKQKTLEEVAAAFGDKVMLVDDGPKRTSVVGQSEHVESTSAGRP